MALRLFLAVVALVGLMWFFGWYGKADAAQRARILKLALLWGVAGLLLLLVVTGRIHWPFALLAALTPWIQRYIVARQAWTAYKSSRGPKSGQTSEVSTQYLQAILDHDTGDMTGQVLQGRHRGRTLESLQRDELLELLEEVRQHDVQATPILEAYLDRIAEGWREADTGRSDGQHGPAQSGPMTEAEALDILGLEAGAGREQVVAAHRRLMQKLHPDRGGNDYLAAQINRAKDVLLGD